MKLHKLVRILFLQCLALAPIAYGVYESGYTCVYTQRLSLNCPASHSVSQSECEGAGCITALFSRGVHICVPDPQSTTPCDPLAIQWTPELAPTVRIYELTCSFYGSFYEEGGNLCICPLPSEGTVPSAVDRLAGECTPS
jgi:hypothetical protein